MKTAQDVFDQVATHLLTQKERALVSVANKNVRCAYRGVDGRKCAVGCLIADEDYNPAMEGACVAWVRRALADEAWLTSENALLKQWLEKSGYEPLMLLLEDLQTLHDEVSVIEEWPEILQSIAEKHGVSGRILKNFQPV